MLRHEMMLMVRYAVPLWWGIRPEAQIVVPTAVLTV